MQLNLGCGLKKLTDYINIDNRFCTRPDVVCDVEQGLPYGDNEISKVRAFDFLEHILPDKVIFVMEEIWRVLQPDGMFEHFTPSTDGRGAFQDPTHRSWWNINSWMYYTVDTYRHLYAINAKFLIITLVDVESEQDRIIHTYGILKADKS